MIKPEEVIIEVVLAGYKENGKVELACSGAIQKSAAKNSNFAMSGNCDNKLKPAIIIGLMDSTHGYAVSIWRLSEEDGVYRKEADIETERKTTSKYTFRIFITKSNGYNKRTDVSIY